MELELRDMQRLEKKARHPKHNDGKGYEGYAHRYREDRKFQLRMREFGRGEDFVPFSGDPSKNGIAYWKLDKFAAWKRGVGRTQLR